MARRKVVLIMARMLLWGGRMFKNKKMTMVTQQKVT